MTAVFDIPVLSQASLFPREWRVQVDTLDVTAIDLEFKILNTIKPQPNKCVLTLWNLTQDHRAQVVKRAQPGTGSKGVPVQIEAGYRNNRSVLFSGDLREAASQRDNTDFKTIVSGDDGGRAYRESSIDATFAKGTPASVILQQCASAMGLGLGNAGDFEATAAFNGVGAVLPAAMTLSGPAQKELTRLCESMGLAWSIQRGALQVRVKGKPLAMTAVQISPSTGLVGSPEAAIDATVSLGAPQQFSLANLSKVKAPPKKKDTSILKLRTLLIPGLIPGRKIVLQSSEFDGAYYITEVEYVGQSFGNDWHCNLIVRVY